MQSTQQSKGTPGLDGVIVSGEQPDPTKQDLIHARWAGWLAAGVGGLILTGWITDLALLRSWFPQQVEAKANAAFCFILLGVALVLKAGEKPAPGRWRLPAANLCAALAALIALLTLGEYTFGWNLGIDQLLFEESVDSFAVVYPGRMTLPASLCVLLLGTAALALRGTHSRTIVTWLVLPEMFVASLTFVGQLYDLPVLTTLGAFTPIAAPAGVTLLLLGAGLLLANGGGVVTRGRRTGRTIGFILALLLLVVMAGSVVRNTQSLTNNNRRVTHTHEVLDRLSGMLSAMQDVETAARGFVLTGNPDFLEHYEPSLRAAGRLQQELRLLTADNPAQQQQLGKLAAAIDGKILVSNRHVALRQAGEGAVAQRDVAGGEGKRWMESIRKIVEEMRQMESRLLEQRQAQVEASTQRTLLTLGLGLAVSITVLTAIFFLLRREIARRTQAEESLAVTLNSIGDGVMATDTEGKITLMNHVAAQLTGWTPAEARGRPVTEVFHIINEETRKPAPIPVEDVLATGEIKGLVNHTALIARDGTERAIADSAAPIRDGTGGILGVVLVFRDVTEAKRTQQEILLGAQKVQAANLLLQAANTELEAFSYSVSHDLRAPLRHVQGYVEMLTREAQTQLSDKARRYLKTIADAAREMGQLIDDLLAFSRMNRTEMQEATVDLGALIQDIRQMLEHVTPGRNIRWNITPLPRVRGDPAMLRQVLANLLDNAVKYTRPRNPAEIEVGCAGEEEGRIIFFVRDNGAGFDMQYTAKLFGVFQRLHRADEFEGTGIGLATVRRIISRHSGRIWAEGRLDAGATFYFTLAPASVGPTPTPDRP